MKIKYFVILITHSFIQLNDILSIPHRIIFSTVSHHITLQCIVSHCSIVYFVTLFCFANILNPIRGCCDRNIQNPVQELHYHQLSISTVSYYTVLSTTALHCLTSYILGRQFPVKNDLSSLKHAYFNCWTAVFRFLLINHLSLFLTIVLIVLLTSAIIDPSMKFSKSLLQHSSSNPSPINDFFWTLFGIYKQTQLTIVFLFR